MLRRVVEAFVARRLMKVDVAVVVARIFPTVSCVEVAVILVPSNQRREFEERVVLFVPPELIARALESVSAPVAENDDVADCPKYAVFPFTFVAKKLEVVAVVAVSVPPTMTLPAVSMEVVAVPPKYARYAESMVEEEFVNCWRAVHAFAFVRLSAREEADPPIKAPRVPVTESVPPVVREEVATDWYTLLPPYTI